VSRIPRGFAFVLCRCGCGEVATIYDDHYRRKQGYRRGHSPSTRPPRRPCIAAECGNIALAHGLCSAHYNRVRRHGSLDDPRPPETERFWRKVRKEDGCWWWTGAVDGQYGRFWIGPRTQSGRIVQAHRYAYERLVGPIPDGLHIDHLCCNKLCVNPAHLEPVTGVENVQRGIRRARSGQPSMRPSKRKTGATSSDAQS